MFMCRGVFLHDGGSLSETFDDSHTGHHKKGKTVRDQSIHAILWEVFRHKILGISNKGAI